MKTKESQAKYMVFRRILLCALWSLILALISFPIVISASSSSNDYSVENLNLIEERLADIGKKISEYRDEDSSGGKIAERVTQVLNEYRLPLLSLENHEDLSKRPLSAEIELAYTKCTSAGSLAWIYYSAIAEIDDASALSKIRTAYQNELSDVDASISAETLRVEQADFCAALNRAIYGEKLLLLEREGDSSECIGIIELAVGSIAVVKDPEPDAPQLSLIYEETRTALNLQRARTALELEIKDVFLIVRPNEDFYNNRKISLFLIQLSDCESITEMNEAARIAIKDICPATSSEGYAFRFINGINIAVSDVALRASTAGVTGEFLPIFKGYTLSYKKACAKDEISALFAEYANSEEIGAIEEEFNKDGGIIDSCSDSARIDAEVLRAGYKKELYDALNSALLDLEIIMGSYPKAEAEEKLKNCASTAQKELDALKPSSQNFVENCNILLSKYLDNFESILNNYKAQRFLLDNKQIITKPISEITKADETALRSSLISYSKLSESVRSLVLSEIESIVEKYKSSLSDRIRSLRENDSLYKDLCASITNELKNLSSESIDVFYNKCDLILRKADILSEAVAYYRSLCSQDLYSSYSNDERQDLSAVCETAAEELSATDIADVLDYENRLNNVLKNTIIKFERINCSAEVRISTRSSKNANIQKMAADARSLIYSYTDLTEMRALTELTVFKINRLLTSEAIISQCKKTNLAVQNMKFLTAEEKALFSAEAETLKKNYADSAALSESLTVLSFWWESFSEEISALNLQASKKDLQRSKENYSSLISDDLSELESELSAMAHLSKKRIEELLSSAIAISSKFTSDIHGCESSEKVAEAYTAALEQLKAIRLSASSENLKNYKDVIKREMDALAPNKDHYSKENYNSILNIIKQGKEELSTCSKISECTTLLSSLKEEIEEVNDLLDDARDEALSALTYALRKCTDNASLYSAENLALAKSIYNESVKGLSAFTKISELTALKNALAQGLKLIGEVRKDVLYSSGAENMLSTNAQYPLGHNFATRGYWGRIYSKNGISSSALLSISRISTNIDTDELQSLIRKAAKNGQLKIYGSVDGERLNLMKKCIVSLGLDITLSQTVADADEYTLQMLLPSSLKEENILGLVFVDENGRVEYYPTQQRDMLISLDLSHMSKYYVVCENTVNLTPLLIFLIILLVFEVIAFCFILFIRYNRKRKEKDMIPQDFFYGFSPLLASSALKITPNNAATLTVLLTVAALALGCGIAFLARAELSASKRRASPQHSRRSPARTPEETPEALPESEQQKLAEGQEIPVLCGARTESEEDIQAFILKENIPNESETSEQDDTKSGSRRAEVNLDVIAKRFKSGELVTLEELKRKHLVSPKTEHVKILARGTLTKPLVIEAHDFSRSAEEMLRAIGGEAIRIE